jgi:N-acetylneuraminate synthase
MAIYLIAEIGINHNGDLELAKKLIKESKDAGFDAVKFQKRTIDAVYDKEFLNGLRESPFGKTQRDQKEGIEFTKQDYIEIDEYCKKIDIHWSASPWDLESLNFIEDFNVPFHKVASPMLGNIPLLKAIASCQKKTFISTGMSTIEEIDAVVNIFQEKDCPFELMHCNSSYPMQVDDANLKCITSLQERYKVNVGYSGHETCLITVSLVAVSLGATSIERHITIDRSMYGSDQASSIETKSLKSFVTAVRSVDSILGSGKKVIFESEKEARNKLRLDVK